MQCGYSLIYLFFMSISVSNLYFHQYYRNGWELIWKLGEAKTPLDQHPMYQTNQTITINYIWTVVTTYFCRRYIGHRRALSTQSYSHNYIFPNYYCYRKNVQKRTLIFYSSLLSFVNSILHGIKVQKQGKHCCLIPIYWH